MDSTHYEIFMTPDQPVNTPIRNISFISSKRFQSTPIILRFGIRFTSTGSSPYFNFINMSKTVVLGKSYDNDVSYDIETAVLVVAKSVPPDDYKMQVIVYSHRFVLRSDIVIHVVTQLPPLPPPSK